MKISIHNEGDSGRKRQWRVTVCMNGNRTRRYFNSRAEAEFYAVKTRTTLKAGGDPGAIEKAVRLSAGSAYGVDVLVEHALACIKNSGIMPISRTATFADGVRLYLDKQAQAGVRPTTLMQTKAALRSLEKVFGDRLVISITDGEIDSFLALLKNRQGQPGGASTTTKLRTLKYIKSVFRAMGFAQPFAAVRKPRPTSEERGVKFFDVDQFIAIMSAARPNERGMLAIAFLAGMRPLLLEKLPTNCVDMIRRVIVIPSHFSIERHEHHLETECIHPGNGSYFPGLPSVLWAWLEIYPFEPRPWGPMQKRLAGKIGFWHQDGCRNTAATFYNKLHGMAAAAKLLYPEGDHHGMIRHHYVPVSSAEAERFYSLNPTDFLKEGPTDKTLST